MTKPKKRAGRGDKSKLRDERHPPKGAGTTTPIRASYAKLTPREQDIWRHGFDHGVDASSDSLAHAVETPGLLDRPANERMPKTWWEFG